MTGIERDRHVDVTDDRDVTVIRLNRPEKLNALTPGMLRQVAADLRMFGAGDARGIVLTGVGRAFSAGEDLVDLDVAQESSSDDIELFQDLTHAVLETRVPVVAAINGIAVGGAAEMTLVCDLRVGNPSAEYFFPENTRGLTISNGASRMLPRLVSRHAMPIVLDARRLNANESHAVGLLDEIVAHGRSVVDAAVTRILEWTLPGRTTAEHLALLRPAIENLEGALDSERRAAQSAWERGASAAGVLAFRGRNSRSGR
jgi:enoyl-CoA hydratase